MNLELGIWGYVRNQQDTQKERKLSYIDKEEPSRVEEDFGSIDRNLESRCVCFGVCVNNGDHVGILLEKERWGGAGRIRERLGGCGGGEKKFP